MKKIISSIMLVTFVTSLIVSPAGAQLLPVPGTPVALSAGFQPPVLMGLKIHPENPLLFDFIVDQGAVKLSDDELKLETEKLVKYFLAALTIPDKEVWVNLSPYEKDRVIPDALGQTTMGKTMLEQDYMLKQLASSLTNPDEKLGRDFWANVKNQVQAQLKTADVPMSTFNKVWIVPQKAEVLESEGVVLVGEKRLKVMMDQDYLAMEKNGQADSGKATDVNTISSGIFKETVLPSIEKEINEGKNFADVRQIYNSVILATWYKKALKESLLGKVYADKGKVAGVETDDKQMKQKIYEQYLAAFRKGVYNLIREDSDSSTGDTIPRKYFSGGIKIANFTASSSLAERAISVAQAGQLIERATSKAVRVQMAEPKTNEGSVIASSSLLPADTQRIPSGQLGGADTISSLLALFQKNGIRYQELADYINPLIARLRAQQQPITQTAIQIYINEQTIADIAARNSAMKELGLSKTHLVTGAFNEWMLDLDRSYPGYLEKSEPLAWLLAAVIDELKQPRGLRGHYLTEGAHLYVPLTDQSMTQIVFGNDRVNVLFSEGKLILSEGVIGSQTSARYTAQKDEFVYIGRDLASDHLTKLPLKDANLTVSQTHFSVRLRNLTGHAYLEVIDGDASKFLGSTNGTLVLNWGIAPGDFRLVSGANVRAPIQTPKSVELGVNTTTGRVEVSGTFAQSIDVTTAYVPFQIGVANDKLWLRVAPGSPEFSRDSQVRFLEFGTTYVVNRFDPDAPVDISANKLDLKVSGNSGLSRKGNFEFTVVKNGIYFDFVIKDLKTPNTTSVYWTDIKASSAVVLKKESQAVKLTAEEGQFDVEFGTNGARAPMYLVNDKGEKTAEGPYTTRYVSRVAGSIGQVALSQLAAGQVRLKDPAKGLRVLVAYDARKGAVEFAQAAYQAVSAFEGIKVDMADGITTSPDAAFLSTQYDVVIQITASHNPENDNGIKVFTEGIVATDQFASLIQQQANSPEGRTSYSVVPYNPATVNFVNAFKLSSERKQNVFSNLAQMVAAYRQVNPNAVMVVDLMGGAAAPYAEQFAKLGIQVVGKEPMSERQYTNKKGAIYSPNPTIAENYGAEFDDFRANAPDGSIFFGLDGDVDRLVVWVKNQGQMTEIKPNDLGMLYLDNLLSKLAKSGSLEGKTLVVGKTLPTTLGLDLLAKKYGIQIFTVPVGSKNFRSLLENPNYIVVVATEESGHQVLTVGGQTFFDDAVTQLYQVLQMIGESQKNPAQLTADLRKDIGFSLEFANTAVKLGDAAMTVFLEKMKTNPQEIITAIEQKIGAKAEKVFVITADNNVIEFTPGMKLKPEQGLYFLFRDSQLGAVAWVYFRKSGTEPTMRIYRESDGKNDLLLQLGKEALGVSASSSIIIDAMEGYDGEAVASSAVSERTASDVITSIAASAKQIDEMLADFDKPGVEVSEQFKQQLFQWKDNVSVLQQQSVLTAEQSDLAIIEQQITAIKNTIERSFHIWIKQGSNAAFKNWKPSNSYDYQGKVMYHVVPLSAWKAQKNGDYYRSDRFAADGFIHFAADVDTALAIANRAYGTTDGEVVVLKVNSLATTGSGRLAVDNGQSKFPHLYGAMPTGAVVKEIVLGKNKDGVLEMAPDILQGEKAAASSSIRSEEILTALQVEAAALGIDAVRGTANVHSYATPDDRNFVARLFRDKDGKEFTVIEVFENENEVTDFEVIEGNFIDLPAADLWAKYQRASAASSAIIMDIGKTQEGKLEVQSQREDEGVILTDGKLVAGDTIDSRTYMRAYRVSTFDFGRRVRITSGRYFPDAGSFDVTGGGGAYTSEYLGLPDRPVVDSVTLKAQAINSPFGLEVKVSKGDAKSFNYQAKLTTPPAAAASSAISPVLKDSFLVNGYSQGAIASDIMNRNVVSYKKEDVVAAINAAGKSENIEDLAAIVAEYENAATTQIYKTRAYQLLNNPAFRDSFMAAYVGKNNNYSARLENQAKDAAAILKAVGQNVDQLAAEFDSSYKGEPALKDIRAKRDLISKAELVINASSGVNVPTVASAATVDANKFTKGGIDFDPTNMNLQIKRDGKGVPLPLPQQNLEQINIDGLVPIIINIVPMNTETLPIFLGQAEKEPGREPDTAMNAAS